MALRQRHVSLGTRPVENGLSYPHFFLWSVVRNRNTLSSRSWKQMSCPWVASGNPIDTQFYLWPDLSATVTETGSVLASALFSHFTFFSYTVMGWVVPPFPQMIGQYSYPQNLWMLPYLETMLPYFAEVRILRRDYPGLSVWALNPKTSFLIRSRRGENTDRRKQCDQEGRDWSVAATNQGMLVATEEAR